MKHQPRFRFLLHLICLSAFLTPTAFGVEKPKPSPEVGPGLTYIQERHGSEPFAIHILQIDRSRSDFSIDTTLAYNTIFRLMRTSEQVKRIPASMGEPVAAVNGDFFLIAPGPYQGDLSGLQIMNGELISAPWNVAFWIDAEGKPHHGEVKSQMKVVWPDGTETAMGLNQGRGKDSVILYTPRLGETTRTQGGVEVVLEAADKENWLPLQANRSYKAGVKTVLQGGNTTLSPEIMILSIPPELAGKASAIKPGDVLTLSTDMTPNLRGVRAAMGGHPMILQDGKMCEYNKKDRYLTTGQPRTIIGWNDKFMYWVVVDGRQAGLSRGMTFEEMANLMLRLGCVEAINLDGGGSSTFWLGGEIMNSPSDGHERCVANALVLLRKPQPTTAKAQ